MGGAAGLLLAVLALLLPRYVIVPLTVAGGIFVTAALSIYFARTFNPRTAFQGCPLLVRLPEPAEKTIALTFDDGPHPDTTPAILDALAADGSQATFFVVGERASQHPQLVRRMAEEGHTIGVHGLRHRTMVLQNAREIEHDLEEAVRRIEGAAGTSLPRPLPLRPPYGFKTETLARTARRLGFVIVAWSLDPRDYDPTDADTLTAAVMARAVPGDVVLLHERPELPAAAAALPRLLAACREKGWSSVRLVAVADATHHPKPEPADG